MSFKVFNSLSRRLEPFEPLDPGGRKVGFYCCGPTVHDFAHVGNFRTFVFADVMRRYLEFKGFTVRHVMNITDVEDKIIKRVAEARVPLREYTLQYEKAFLDDLSTLNGLRPHELPHATDHIPEIIALIERLVARGLAYRAPDGSVYFSIERYQASGHQYGQLVRLNFEKMRAGDRVNADEYDKEAIADFALWKARVPEDGEVFWESPWGQGRPGWHIECSAMSMQLLGPSFDLHLGGEDLAFPHHEDEIAQSEGAGLQPPDRRFVKYWMHVAHLMVESRKMSKSLGNFFTLRDLLARGFSGRQVRYLLLQARYRETFNFTLKGLEDARSALARLDECLTRLHELGAAGGPGPAAAADPAILSRVEEALDDDLNVSAAWGAVFEWVRELNRELAAGTMTPARAAAAGEAWARLDAVFGLGQPQEEGPPPELQQLLEQRQQARQARDFQRSDAIRNELKTRGWLIEDTPKGPRLKRA